MCTIACSLSNVHDLDLLESRCILMHSPLLYACTCAVKFGPLNASPTDGAIAFSTPSTKHFTVATQGSDQLLSHPLPLAIQNDILPNGHQPPECFIQCCIHGNLGRASYTDSHRCATPMSLLCPATAQNWELGVLANKPGGEPHPASQLELREKGGGRSPSHFESQQSICGGKPLRRRYHPRRDRFKVLDVPVTRFARSLMVSGWISAMPSAASLPSTVAPSSVVICFINNNKIIKK